LYPCAEKDRVRINEGYADLKFKGAAGKKAFPNKMVFNSAEKGLSVGKLIYFNKFGIINAGYNALLTLGLKF